MECLARFYRKFKLRQRLLELFGRMKVPGHIIEERSPPSQRPRIVSIFRQRQGLFIELPRFLGPGNKGQHVERINFQVEFAGLPRPLEAFSRRHGVTGRAKNPSAFDLVTRPGPIVEMRPILLNRIKNAVRLFKLSLKTQATSRLGVDIRDLRMIGMGSAQRHERCIGLGWVVEVPILAQVDHRKLLSG